MATHAIRLTSRTCFPNAVFRRDQHAGRGFDVFVALRGLAGKCDAEVERFRVAEADVNR